MGFLKHVSLAIRYYLLILGGHLLLSFSLWAAPSGMDHIEAITARHQTLESFLSHSVDQEKYFQALKAYMGEDKLNRTQFDAIMGQVKEMVQKVPELSTRLWQTGGTGSRFSFTASTGTQDRSLNKEMWESHLRERKEKLTRDSQYILSRRHEDQETLIEKMIADIQRQEASLDVKGLSQAQKRNRVAEHFKTVRSSNEVQTLAAYYANLIMSEERNVDLLSSWDPDLTLDVIKDMRDNPRRYIPGQTKIPGSVMTEIKNLLFDRNVILKNTELFPLEIRTGVTTYDFVPVSRRFHGIWKGLNECVGGKCNSLQWLSPERWATVAIADSHLQYMEKEGHFAGFVEAVPGKINDVTVASTSFGAPDMRKKMFITGADGSKINTTLYEAWLKRSIELKPKNWSGFVISKTFDIDNAGVLKTVRSSKPYAMGLDMNPGGESFTLQDPLAKQISLAKPSQHYSDGNMILDATTPASRGESTLTLLEISKLSQNEELKIIEEKLKNPNLNTGALNYLEAHPEVLDKFRDELPKIFLNMNGDKEALNTFATFLLKRGLLEFTSEEIAKVVSGENKDVIQRLFSKLPKSKKAYFFEALKNSTTKHEVAVAAVRGIDPGLDLPDNRKFVHEMLELGMSKTGAVPGYAYKEKILAQMAYDIAIEKLEPIKLSSFLSGYNSDWFTDEMFHKLHGSKASVEDIVSLMLKTKDAIDDPKNLALAKEYFRTHGYFYPQDKKIRMRLRALFPYYEYSSAKHDDLVSFLLSNPKEINSSLVMNLELSDPAAKNIMSMIASDLAVEKDIKEIKRLVGAALQFGNDPAMNDLIQSTFKRVDANFKLTDEDFLDFQKSFKKIRLDKRYVLPQESFPRQFGRYLTHSEYSLREAAIDLRADVWKPKNVDKRIMQKLGTVVATNSFSEFPWNANFSSLDQNTFKVFSESIVVTDPKLPKLIAGVASADPEEKLKVSKALAGYDMKKIPAGACVNCTPNCILNGLNRLYQDF